MSKYEELRRAGLREGERYRFSVRTPIRDGFEVDFGEETVERLAGGGFGGGVALLEKRAIKTGVPDNIHGLIRVKNTPHLFYLESSPTAVELAVIAGKVLPPLIDRLTDGTVYVPEALGYSHISQRVGYGIHIEKIDRNQGRPADFYQGQEENIRIQMARLLIWKLRHKIGAEHIAQIHPDNPFGKPNIWIDPTNKNRVVWLDYLPAILHTGKVWPWYYFKFQDTMQIVFNRYPSFDKLQTNWIRRTLMDERKFSRNDQRYIMDLLDLYNERWQIHEKWLKEDPKKLIIEDALNRGLVTRDYADKMRASDGHYHFYQGVKLARLAAGAGVDILVESPLNVLHKESFIRLLPRLFTDTEFRRKWAADHSIYKGAEMAYEHGIITKAQLAEMKQEIPAQEMGVYIDLQASHQLYSRVVSDPLSVAVAAASVLSGHPEGLALAGFINVWSPGIFRLLSTMGVAIAKGDGKLAVAALATIVPGAGNYLPIPTMLTVKYGKKAGAFMHYNLRAIVATISKLRPGGGMGSDREEQIWNAGERKIEKTQEVFNAAKEKAKKKTKPIQIVWNGTKNKAKVLLGK